MTDGIIKGDGTSRLLKGSAPATYDEFRALFNGEGVLADVIFNSAGWQILPTFLNKANLLTDSVSAILGLSGEQATVNNALLTLFAAGRRVVQVTVKTTNGLAVSGVHISGLTGPDGASDIFADENGVAVGFASSDSTTISVADYIDLSAASAVISTPIDTVQYVSLEVGLIDFVLSESSKQTRISSLCSRIDVSACGGGGRGGDGGGNAASIVDDYGGGGGGGYVSVKENVDFTPDALNTLSVGAANGGTSSFLGVTASGGKNGGRNTAGTGNGNGGLGSGSAGGNGTGTIFTSMTETVPCGGGGGSGAPAYGSAGAGGNPNGGRGGGANGEPYAAENGKGYGGGGGGGGANTSYGNSNTGGNGYQGVVSCRMWH